MSYGKRELSVMEEVLDDDYETVSEAALAAYRAAEGVFAKRCSFAVVGQLWKLRGGHVLDPSDPEAIRVCLGWFSTEGDARKAAESLWHNTASGETWRCWVLPVFHGTPADLHSDRKKQYVAQQEKAEAAQRDRLKQSIAARQEALGDPGKRVQCDTCSHPAYEHMTDGSGSGKCGLQDCSCPAWREPKRGGKK